MRELASGLAPWDWSGAEVVVFGRPGHEISPSIRHDGQPQITTELRAMYVDLVHQPLRERLLELLANFDQS